MAMQFAGVPAQAYVRDGVLVFGPRALHTSPHALCAAALLVSLEGPLRLSGPGFDGSECGALLAPGVPHATSCPGPALVVLIDPDDDAYRFMHPVLAGARSCPLAPEVLGRLRVQARSLFEQRLEAAAAERLLDGLLRTVCPAPLARLPWDGRVLRACRRLREALPDCVPIRVLAGELGLSSSRFMHLFREAFRMPLRKYLLWLRIRRAMRLWRDERAVAGVALGSGFYDQAHFTRTMRRMTGYAPSLLRPPEIRVSLAADLVVR